MDNKDLFGLILSLDLVEKKTLEIAYNQCKDGGNFRQTLIDKGILTNQQINETIAQSYNLPYIDLSTIGVKSYLDHSLNVDLSKKLGIVLIGEDTTNNLIKVACSDPSDTEKFDNIKKKLGQNIKLYYASENEIDQFISSAGFKTYSSTNPFKDLLEQINEDGTPGEHTISDILTKIVALAIQYSASDIHIEPEENQALLRYRIDGILEDISIFPLNIHERLTARIKVISKLKTDEHLSAQDGKMHQIVEGEKVDIRISIVPITYGEKVVMRVLSNRVRNYTLQDLGISDEDFEKIKAGYSAPDGMVLSTGPTASGKTTTIYSIIRAINSKDVNIATIEDPVEYTIERVNQIQVNNDTNLSFSNGLKSILRQDPDVIFVGEIRDSDTAKIAVNSAMTGHLVLSTLHTNNAAMTVPRLFNMGIEPFLIASTVRVVIAQRLVRKICESCRQSIEYTPGTNSNQDNFVIENQKYLELVPKNLIEKYFNTSAYTLFKGKGCPVCHNTGYSGRIGLFEVLTITPEISELISRNATMDEIEKKAISLGMKSILEDGLLKVAKGQTTFEEIFRVIQDT